MSHDSFTRRLPVSGPLTLWDLIARRPPRVDAFSLATALARLLPLAVTV